MNMSVNLSPGRIAQLACVIEATARKPGNVHRLIDFEDMHFLDYMLSAIAIGPVLDRAESLGVGATVEEAVVATRALVDTNTNFGLIVILAPLAAVPRDCELKAGVRSVLERTTVDDARAFYRALRLAKPGGMGAVSREDAASAPTVCLIDAMRLAVDRDSLARQYVHGYEDVFETGVPSLVSALDAGQSLEEAVVTTALTLMSRLPDTLIARKRGRSTADEAAERAAEVLNAGWPTNSHSINMLSDLDSWLRGDGHARNPGTTADLVAACLYAAIRCGSIRFPRESMGRETIDRFMPRWF